ncbi:unnamed protein product [Pseudo-nitzschia multistriata]|uniref:Flavoprotein domain-containing protein n=1 Tax=Pseudo-nitzschia multistriata TaxID=183589 RepID=A0A448Z6H2_9STRA|nr:unnamed protein product [Pseudo-nitzschia multistriata]
MPPDDSSWPLNRRRRRPRILFAVTGSVAAVKGPEIAVRLVRELDSDVRILLTRGGENFWSKARDYNLQYWDTLQGLLRSSGSEGENNDGNGKCSEPRISVCYADDEWKEWKKLGDPVLHIDLRDWADLLLVAPLSAHTLAKMAHGFCDDTLSCVVRAWDFGHGPRPGKPLLLAPAMNTAMWDHPLTQAQLSAIRGFFGATPSQPENFGKGMDKRECSGDTLCIVAPQVKTLACGEVGNGALASPDEILRVVSTVLGNNARDSTGSSY